MLSRYLSVKISTSISNSEHENNKFFQQFQYTITLQICTVYQYVQSRQNFVGIWNLVFKLLCWHVYSILKIPVGTVFSHILCIGTFVPIDNKNPLFSILGSSADRRNCRHCRPRDCSNKLQVSPRL
jgi:hypothetical protein